ncbi:Hypothetical protein, putative [Bodo saltans]|uniref:Uncharacterized protein n=1 Tax=Bodo saltans TaxID=75058 RepID=A0A0S4JR75_BODSA|nr:Hypothetical protein, putative [Bodo saltans]|eukprot:CUG91822.1 Hypothetical protein, putative [Bodo saltans]
MPERRETDEERARSAASVRPKPRHNERSERLVKRSVTVGAKVVVAKPMNSVPRAKKRNAASAMPKPRRNERNGRPVKRSVTVSGKVVAKPTISAPRAKKRSAVSARPKPRRNERNGRPVKRSVTVGAKVVVAKPMSSVPRAKKRNAASALPKPRRNERNGRPVKRSVTVSHPHLRGQSRSSRVETRTSSPSSPRQANLKNTMMTSKTHLSLRSWSSPTRQSRKRTLRRRGSAAPAPSTSSSSGAAASGGGGGSPAPDRAGVVGQSRFGADDLQRQKYRQQFEKDKERGEALRRLVVFDEVSMVIADIPPLSEYDMYIRNFGGTGRTQSGVQAPALEDKIDVEVQAERVASKSKMSQCPEDLGLFPERAAAAQTATTADDGESGAPGATRKIAGPTAVDATMLSSFLSRVFPVMRTLLDESHFGHGANIKKSTIPLSDSFTTFAAKETAGRPVQRILYNPTASQYVLCLHGAKVGHANAPEKRLPSDRSDGLAVVWNINDQTMPDKLLTHSCSLNAACFSPSRPHLVYGGGNDGAVCIWDLRETDSLHHSDDKVSTITLRAPSFTTEWQHENHKAPIVQMCVAGYNSILGNRRDENDQLVTLDQDGNVHFWMVNDGTGNGGGSAANSGGGASSGKQTSLSDQDHGQLMGSIVRCFRAASLSVGRPLPSKSSTSSSSSLGGSLLSYESPQSSSNNNKLVGNAFDFDFCPADPSRFVVAAGASLHHLSRFSSIAAPSSYGPHSQFFGDAASAPSACSFSTLDSRILIGGYSDGSVRVYLRDEALPQLSIPISFTPIRQVQTSNTIKLITFALDENGVFYILDHGIDEKEVPVVQCSAGTPQTGKCTAFSTPLEDKGSSQLAFGFEDGSFQLHTLNNKWLAPPNTRSERWL